MIYWSTSRHTEIDEDNDIDELQFNEEDYDEHDDDEIEEKEDNSYSKDFELILNVKHQCVMKLTSM
jgi:hypothetical protein